MAKWKPRGGLTGNSGLQTPSSGPSGTVYSPNAADTATLTESATGTKVRHSIAADTIALTENPTSAFSRNPANYFQYYFDCQVSMLLQFSGEWARIDIDGPLFTLNGDGFNVLVGRTYILLSSSSDRFDTHLYTIVSIIDDNIIIVTAYNAHSFTPNSEGRWYGGEFNATNGNNGNNVWAVENISLISPDPDRGKFFIADRTAMVYLNDANDVGIFAAGTVLGFVTTPLQSSVFATFAAYINAGDNTFDHSRSLNASHIVNVSDSNNSGLNSFIAGSNLGTVGQDYTKNATYTCWTWYHAEESGEPLILRVSGLSPFTLGIASDADYEADAALGLEAGFATDNLVRAWGATFGAGLTYAAVDAIGNYVNTNFGGGYTGWDAN